MSGKTTLYTEPVPPVVSTSARTPRHAAKVHLRALGLYSLVVLGHFAEHVVQAYQVYILRWHPRVAGGLLGLYYPSLAQNEVLHIAYNSAQLTGLILLLAGFRRSSKAAQRWWNVALVAQSWHFFEHVLLQVQYLTGSYLFGAARQTSLLELFFPRVPLHLAYNLVALVPTAIAIGFYLRWYQRNV